MVLSEMASIRGLERTFSPRTERRQAGLPGLQSRAHRFDPGQRLLPFRVSGATPPAADDESTTLLLGTSFGIFV
jgi:hypothetical protein